MRLGALRTDLHLSLDAAVDRLRGLNLCLQPLFSHQLRQLGERREVRCRYLHVERLLTVAERVDGDLRSGGDCAAERFERSKEILWSGPGMPDAIEARFHLMPWILQRLGG